MPVSPVSRSRTPREVIVVAAVSGLIVLGAIAASLAAPDQPPAPPAFAAVAEATDALAATPITAPRGPATAPTPRFEPAGFNRPLPTAIDCHDLAASTCHRLVRAALRVLPDDLPDVERAGAWSSLVCGDDFDCPTAYLEGSVPAGSVHLGFV